VCKRGEREVDTRLALPNNTGQLETTIDAWDSHCLDFAIPEETRFLPQS